MRKRITGNSIKESFDRLPIGICYFDNNGIPVLCNLQMHRLVFAISGKDLQLLSDITDALRDYKNKDGELLLLPDGTVWQIKENTITAEEEYIQYTASDVTKLYQVKKDLEADNAEYAKVLENIKRISGNVVAITREEEVLALKAKIHNKVGVCLQRLRNCMMQAPSDVDYASVTAEMRAVTDMLTREITGNDEPELMDELFSVAKKLGVAIKIVGEMPQEGEAAILLAYTVHECLTNTVSHAGGNELYVNITHSDDSLTAVITDNGEPPRAEIIEGGGLSSLRKRIEKAGGIMLVQSKPRFALKITVSNKQVSADRFYR